MSPSSGGGGDAALQPSLTATFLGTGTSVGVPVLTCDCAVCTSGDERNRRLRASMLLEWPPAGAPARDEGAGAGEDRPDATGEKQTRGRPGGGDRRVKVLIDTSTDLRQQALRLGLERVDAVLYTHEHVDHLLGLDELRIYNFVHRRSIPLYGNLATVDAIRRIFAYAFEPGARGVPRLTLNVVDGAFELFGRRVEPVAVEHGRISINAYRVGGFAYVTDCSRIPEAAAARLRDLDVLVIDALRREPHPAHFTLEEALAEIERLAPRRAFLTHMSHDFDHAALEAELPAGVGVAHDGLVLRVGGAAEGPA